MNKHGKIVIEPQFQQAYDFKEGLATVFLHDGSSGIDVAYIDKSGKIIWQEDERNGYSNGLGDFNNGLLMISHYKNYIHKYGFVNRKGKIVIPPFFEKAWEFHEGMSRVCLLTKPLSSEEEKENSVSKLDQRKRERWGFINTKGELVVPFKYNEVGDFSEGFAHVVEADESEINSDFIFLEHGKHGFIDKKGDVVIPLIYEDAQRFSEGLAPVKLKGKWGFINKKWEIIIPASFDMVEPFHNGMAMVRKTEEETFKEKYGFINKNGKLTIPYKYDFAMDFENGRACVEVNDKCGCINTKGKWLIEPVFDGLIFFSEGIGVTELEKKYGFIDTLGNWIVMPNFQDARSFNNGLAAVVFKGYYYNPEHYTELGYINKKGEYVWKPQW